MSRLSARFSGLASLSAVVVCGLLATNAYRAAGHTPQRLTENVFETRADMTMAGARIPFIANCGQTDKRVGYYARTFAGTVFVTTSGEIVYSLPVAESTAQNITPGNFPKMDGKRYSGLALKEELVGGKIGDIHGEGRTASKISCYTGDDPAQWSQELALYNSVNFGEIYDGIGFTLQASGNNVEKLFYISPGAVVQDIRVRLSGADGLQVSDAGELEVRTDCGVVLFSRPKAYQDYHGITEYVEVAYAVAGDEYGFAVGDYDPDGVLVIDPLLASTFIGGSDLDGLNETPLLRDEYGNIYVADRTSSDDFPVSTGAYQEDYNGGYTDVFIAKFNPNLTSLLAATFLGGSNDEGKWPGATMAMDEAGNIFVTGKTNSTDFPTTAGAYKETHLTSDTDAFIAKLSGDLTTLLAATYFGGSLNEYYITIACDKAGHVFLAGATRSTDIPVTPGAIGDGFSGDAGGPYPSDVFLAKLDDDLTTLLAATYLGGSANEYPEDIELDQSGNVYVTGWTGSLGFPTVPGSYSTSFFGGTYDAFISKTNGDFTVLIASTFLGGTKWDFNNALALDTDNNVYVTGHTASVGFPVSDDAYDNVYANGSGSIEGVNDDAFVSKLDGNLTTVLRSTFLGGAGWDMGNALIVDSDGDVIVAGVTQDGGFPHTPDAHDTQYHGLQDAFISRLDGELYTLSYSTYLGTSKNEIIGSMILDDDDIVFVAGITSSADFPTTALAYGAWPYDQTYNGPGTVGWLEDRGGDVFITKIDLDWATQDYDGDGYLNPDDNCPYAFNIPNDDADLDGLGDVCDNCPATYNPEQEDINFNWIGDSCEIPETWYVQADGLGEAPTIQAAIDSSTHGDTILVADGVYTGVGNCEIDFHGRKRVLLTSANGPQTTIINPQGSSSTPRRAFTIAQGEGAETIIDGLTIRGGYGGSFNGSMSGGGMLCNESSPTVRDCIFADNAAFAGGAVYSFRASPKFVNCTFYDNSASLGSAVFSYDQSSVTLENCIIAFNPQGVPVSCYEGSAVGATCTDIYGNAAGNWVAGLAGQDGANGNFSLNPLFCDTAAGDFSIDDNSPCTPENNECAVLIGALDVACYCDCGVAGDMDCSGVATPLDVAFLVKFVYQAQDALCPAPDCPYPVGDLDCNSQVTPLDVAYIVNAVYKMQNAMCDGCAQ